MCYSDFSSSRSLSTCALLSFSSDKFFDCKAFNAYLQISGTTFSATLFEHFMLDFEFATLLLGVQEVSLHGFTLF